MNTVTTTLEEIIRLGVHNTEFYGRTFFPRSFRQPSASFHKDIDELLDDPRHRYVAMQVFRGSAKTTKLRVYTSKRIAYGISNTILFVSASQDSAKDSLRWVRGQVESNIKWTSTFGLSKGPIWTDEKITIQHRALQFPITLMALGITGQIRGINIDDYRPDLIIVDDVCNEENTATPEQRKKISDLVFGALQNGLTPATESPQAKMVILQTVLDKDDIISQCLSDQDWASRNYGCFNEFGESRWPERYPTEYLLRKKEAHAIGNRIGLWLREMEGVVVGGENADFRPEWINTYPILPDREEVVTVVAVDPVPPPSEKQILSGLHNKDFECVVAVGKDREDRYYILEYAVNRGHTPEWTVSEFFRLCDKWRPVKCVVEAVAYQRTLKWILEQKMHSRGTYYQINDSYSSRRGMDRRTKRHRILQAFSGIGSAGKVFVGQGMTEFREQWCTHPFCKNDDVLDASAMAVAELLDIDATDFLRVEEDYPAEEGFIRDWSMVP